MKRLLKRTGHSLAILGLKRTLFLLPAILLLIFSVPIITRAATFPIVATNIESTQLLITWDGVNNAACEHAVACDPNDPESYVLDVNTNEQRDILSFYDAGYNVGIINWTNPLEAGHTYKVQMRGQGHYRVSQEFVYTPATYTNFTSGTTIINDISVLSLTKVRLFPFSPSIQSVDSDCKVNGVYDLSIDIYINNVLRQTVTGNCTYGVAAPGLLEFYTNNLYGSANYRFTVHSASTGNVWFSGSIDYNVPPFAVSNLAFSHSTGQYSFNYSGYAGGDITGESVSIHASDESWGYNDEPAACTGGLSGSGTCSGTFNLSQGTFSCAPAITVGIYGYHPGASVSGLINPDQACVSPQDLFPGATLGALNVMVQQPNGMEVHVDLPGYYLDCWNDFGFTMTIYDASTNMPVGSATNPNPVHICGFLDNFHRNLNWIYIPGLTLPTGNYWVYAHSNNNPGTWVTNPISFTAQAPPNQAPTVTFTADNPTLNEGDTFTANGSFSDPDSTAWTATVDYGDGTGVMPLTLNPDKTFYLSHVYVDNGSYTITVTVTDNGNLSGSSNGTVGSVVVNNPAPVVPPITPPSNVDQNSPTVINVVFSDYGNQTHTAVVNWGDGSGNQSVPVTGNEFSPEHTYQNPGTYTVIVTITDSEGATTTQTLTITVLNVAPEVGAISFPSSVAVNSPASLTADFSDQGTVDTHTATIDWGDGDVTTGVVTESNGSGSISGDHTYIAPGTYTVTVTVTDDDNGSGQGTASTSAVNQVSVLSPAGVWIGLKNSDDVGTKFDLKAEAFRDNTLVASGELASFAGGSSGFNNAHLASITFDSFAPMDLPSGSVLNIRISVRNACVGSGHNSGTARLWYNDSAANSKFSATIGGTSSDYYLKDLFALAPTPGPGPKKTIDIQAGAKCSDYKPFGTWSTTL